MPRDLLIANYEVGVQILAEIGLPPSQRILVIDGLDTLTVGASLAEAAKSPEKEGQVFASVDAETEPMLAEALAANTCTAGDGLGSGLRRGVAAVRRIQLRQRASADTRRRRDRFR